MNPPTFEQEKRAYGAFGRRTKKKPQLVTTPESAILNAGIRWFFAHGIFCWRNNSGGFKDEHGHFVRYGLPGSSDVIAIQPGTGRAIFAEAKSSKGQQTEKQIAFQAKVEAAGAVYVLFRSLDDLEARKAEIVGHP